MFKTSEQCLIELVARSVGMLDADDTSTYSGDLDFMPCSAARVSFGNEDKTGEDVGKDRKLMKYLADHQHMTPFEYQHATFLIECPLFIRSQIHRHRTFSYNEISRRYTDENLEFWVPDEWRGQATNNRQASSDDVINIESVSYNAGMENMLEFYNNLLAAGVCREQARAVLPQSLLTKFYMGGNLRNWAHFIELRRDPHAQKEVQIVAVRIANKLRELWPESCNALGI